MTGSFPPIVHHSSRRISQSEAHDLVAAYLEAAENDPSLHPDALLTESGPITTSSSTNVGLVLHNLGRVAAGLRGERLGQDFSLDKIAEQDLTTQPPDEPEESTITNGAAAQPELDIEGRMNGKAEGETDATAAVAAVAEAGVGAEEQMDLDWQDRSEWEAEQDVVQGEAGPRNNALGDEREGSVPKLERADKVQKKKDKKMRRLEEKREREITRKIGNGAMEKKRRGARDEAEKATKKKSKGNRVSANT